MHITTEYVIQAVRRHSADVLPALVSVAPQPSGILPSEMLCFASLCREQSISCVVESGRKHGYSTEAIATCLPECRIVSIEQSPISESDKRLAAFANLTLLCGSGQQIAPGMVDGRTALLLDGPKGFGELEVIEQVRSKIAFAAVHDLCFGNEARNDLGQRGEQVWYTDADDITNEYGHLDEFWWKNGGYCSRAELTRSGFCFGILQGGLWA